MSDEIDSQRMIRLQNEIIDLYDIGKSLSSEKDTLKLFEKILNASIRLTSSDAGTLYLVIEKNSGDWSYVDETSIGEKQFKFVIAKNMSIDVKLQASVLPILNTSISGYTAMTGKSLRIDDAYEIDSSKEYSLDRSYDTATGYVTKSLLCVPMKEHSGKVTGVIQLLNKKRDRNLKINYLDASSKQNIIPFNHGDEMLMNSLAGQAAVALENSLLYRDLNKLLQEYKKQNEHLSLLSRKILKAHEEERKRIAREIHDGPAQLASGMVMKLDVCRKLLQKKDVDSLSSELDILGHGLRETVGDIRSIIYDLKPASLDNGLISAVDGHIKIFEEHTGLKVDLRSHGDDKGLEYYIVSTLYRIVQEALSNVHKHAEASGASVLIDIKDDSLKLEISDNGKGFDTGLLSKTRKTVEGGFGIEGIKERVELVRGRVAITSDAGKGTSLSITVPLGAE
ncbi:MAG: GAF domain-containing sensor histidine kinase [Eubacteriales bacterium]|nr:GAF domain-containing sensor histidine kinase [Eubacteriales bacterium]